MTQAERQAALEQIADEVRICTRCRLHQQRTRSVPGEGNPDTEVVFVGEGPGFNEDREGRPFVGRAGGLLVKLLASVGWRREDVFITNVVKCRPPDNRDPQPDEIAACAPFLRRQVQALDPALVVTLGRYSMGTFMPGARIGQAHGTITQVDPATGATDALAFAMYHPAAAPRSTDVEATSFRDMAGVPLALLKAREQRERRTQEPAPDRLEAADAIAVADPGAAQDVLAAPDVAAALNAVAAPDVAAALDATAVPDHVAGPDAIRIPERAQSGPHEETTSPEPRVATVSRASIETAALGLGASTPMPGDKSPDKDSFDIPSGTTNPLPPVTLPAAGNTTGSAAPLPPAGLEPDPTTDQLTLF